MSACWLDFQILTQETSMHFTKRDFLKLSALLTAGGRPLLHMRRTMPDLPFLSPGIIDVTDVPERPDI